MERVPWRADERGGSRLLYCHASGNCPPKADEPLDEVNDSIRVQKAKENHCIEDPSNIP